MKWRKYKKIFKRTIKPKMIGLKVMVDVESFPHGTMMTIHDVFAKPAGGKSIEFSCSLIPQCEPIWDNAENLIGDFEEKIEDNGYSLSFEIPEIKGNINDLIGL
jgi:hypothetical protein